MKKILIVFVLVLVFFIIGFIVSCNIIENGANNGGRMQVAENDKIPDPGGKFSYDKVWVVLTKTPAILEKEWTPADFPGFAFSKIEDGFYFDDVYYKYDGGFLIFHLAEPSRENVLRAVYYLNQRSEIMSAELERLDIVPENN